MRRTRFFSFSIKALALKLPNKRSNRSVVSQFEYYLIFFSTLKAPKIIGAINNDSDMKNMQDSVITNTVKHIAI